MQSPSTLKTPPWTILALLKWTTAHLYARQIEHARMEAEILLAHCLGLRRIDLYLRHDQPLNGEELGRFKALVKRRSHREPTAYITGKKEFWSMTFSVSPDVLIPRPETECLVESALGILASDSGTDARRVLELGTGSGAISVALASERPGDWFLASDASLAALQLARKNARELLPQAKIEWLTADWFKPFQDRAALFDLILSNPPYIRRGDLRDLQPEIWRFEPMAALDGGPDGMDCLRRIIPIAHRYLKPKGYLVLEIGYDQRSEVQRIAEGCGQYDGIGFARDYGGHDRVALMRRAAKSKKTLRIKDGFGNNT
jgi:release factor glutamine methyltransferase